MNPAIVKRILLPLHEAFVGRPTLARAAELESSQWESPQTLRRLQQHKLRRLLAHAWHHCPFYRAVLADLNLSPQRMTGLDDLGQLPVLTKADIRRNGRAMCWPNVSGGLRPYNTGGSTGEPLLFHFDLGRQASDQAARIRTHRWFGADVGDPEVYLWGSPVELTRQDRLKTLRDRLTNQLLLNAFAMSAERMDDYLNRIERYNPVSLFGYPSSLALLCRHAQGRRRQLRLPCLKAVFATGERLEDHDRRLITDSLGVPVANGYGSREGGFIAHECPHGSMHITSEDLVVEILGDSNRPVPDGQPGQIVITHLETFGMPFIRYATGDVGRRAAGTCPCGRGLELMQVVEGRRTDFVVASDGTIQHALSVIYVLREIASVRQFQIVQSEHRDLEVRVVSDAGLSAQDRQRIETGLRKRLGHGLAIQITQTPRIEPSASGKHRYVISSATTGISRSDNSHS